MTLARSVSFEKSPDNARYSGKLSGSGKIDQTTVPEILKWGWTGDFMGGNGMAERSDEIYLNNHQNPKALRPKEENSGLVPGWFLFLSEVFLFAPWGLGGYLDKAQRRLAPEESGSSFSKSFKKAKAIFKILRSSLGMMGGQRRSTRALTATPGGRAPHF